MKKKSMIISGCVVLICALALLAVSALTAARAQVKQEESLAEVMGYLLPGSTDFSQEAYSGEDENITAVYKAAEGYVIETAVQGYVDEIVLLVGVRNEGTVSGITVREIAETNGLGNRAMRDVDFLSQFLNTSGDASVGETIDAMSGATVTSKSITKAVNSAVAFVTGADVSSGATEWSG